MPLFGMVNGAVRLHDKPDGCFAFPQKIIWQRGRTCHSVAKLAPPKWCHYIGPLPITGWWLPFWIANQKALHSMLCVVVRKYIRTYASMYMHKYMIMYSAPGAYVQYVRTYIQYVCMYVHTPVCSYVRTYVHTYIMHICTYVCMCVRTYLLTRVGTWGATSADKWRVHWPAG